MKILNTPIGKITIATSKGRLSLCRPYKEGDTVSVAEIEEQLLANRISNYFNGEDTLSDIEVAPEGTSFQRRVWKAIKSVPYGQTVTYSELARRIGHPTAVRAVASACGANPVMLAVPCHRIVAASSLGGFSIGPEAKTFLLNLEQSPA